MRTVIKLPNLCTLNFIELDCDPISGGDKTRGSNEQSSYSHVSNLKSQSILYHSRNAGQQETAQLLDNVIKLDTNELNLLLIFIRNMSSKDSATQFDSSPNPSETRRTEQHIDLLRLSIEVKWPWFWYLSDMHCCRSLLRLEKNSMHYV